MDFTLIEGTITGLKVAGDIAKSLLELKTLAEVQGRVIDLQSTILQAQSSALSANAEQAKLIDTIRKLEEEVTRAKDWAAQKERYKLQPIPDTGSVAYALKNSMANGEPPHLICTKCYEDGKRMILQPRLTKERKPLLACPECGSEIHTRYNSFDDPAYAE